MSEPHATPEEDEVERPLLHDTIVRLENESNKHQVPLKDVFQGASRGELELLFQRPALFPRTVLRPLGRDPVIGEPCISRIPDYLVLTQEPCLQLLDRPSALVIHAHAGYRSRSANSFLTQMLASDADKSKSFPVQVEGKDFVAPETNYGYWGSWAFWSDGGPVQYQVRPEDVFVRQGEFKRWRLQYFDPRPEKSPKQDQSEQTSKESSEPNPDMSDDHQSPSQLPMCDAALAHGAHDSVVSDNPPRLPPDGAVAVTPLDNSKPARPRRRRSEAELGEIYYYTQQHGVPAAAQKYELSERYIRDLRRKFQDLEERKMQDQLKQRPHAALQGVWPQNGRTRT